MRRAQREDGETWDVVVVGGGISGLHVARRLLEKGYTVRVLESKSYLGGRVFTHPKLGYECGAARYQTAHKHMSSLVRKYDLKTFALSKGYDYWDERSGSFVKDVNLLFNERTKRVVRQLKGRSASELRKVTLRDACLRYLKMPQADVQEWVDMFGYTSEIETLNAYDALLALDSEFVDREYRVLKGGMTRLIDAIAKDVRARGGEISLNHAVVDVHVQGTDGFEIQAVMTEGKARGKRKGVSVRDTIWAKQVVMAVPPLALAKIPYVKRLLGPKVLNCVKPSPLLRIYAMYDKAKTKVRAATASSSKRVKRKRYTQKTQKTQKNQKTQKTQKTQKKVTRGARGGKPMNESEVRKRRRRGVWFEGVRRFTTSSKLRHVIPIREERGLIMVSYTDGKDTKPYANVPERTAKRRVHSELKRIFPDRDIPQPTYFKRHLWPDGAYYWAAGCDSRTVGRKVINPARNFYVCGEGFSHKQAWMEGALETAEEVIRRF